MADTVNIYDAKTNLSKLVDRAAAGEEIVIAKAGKPKAKLVPYQPSRKKRRFGQNLLGIITGVDPVWWTVCHLGRFGLLEHLRLVGDWG